jgi:hypothetical protein
MGGMEGNIQSKHVLGLWESSYGFDILMLGIFSDDEFEVWKLSINLDR